MQNSKKMSIPFERRDICLNFAALKVGKLEHESGLSASHEIESYHIKPVQTILNHFGSCFS